MKRRGIAFLNKPGKSREATISWEIPTKDDSGFIVISDCSRKISLDLYLYDKAEMQNSLYKVNTLLGQLFMLKDSLLSQIEKTEFNK